MRLRFGKWLDLQHSRTRTRLKPLSRKAKAARDNVLSGGRGPEPAHGAAIATTFYTSGCVLHLAELYEHFHILLPILALAGLPTHVG